MGFGEFKYLEIGSRMGISYKNGKEGVSEIEEIISVCVVIEILKGK